MTIQEFSDQFDVLFNNVTSNQAPGLNEYEKSVVLTKAEKQLVRENFNQRTDAVGGGFDGSQKRQYDFSCLIRTESLYNINTYADRIDETEKLDRRSLVYLFPENYFLSVNEILSDARWQYSVMPIDYAEYQRLMLKPYSLPVKRGAWRLITSKRNCNFWKEEIVVDHEYAEMTKKETEYSFVTTWAIPGKELKVRVRSNYYDDLPSTPEGGSINFKFDGSRANFDCSYTDGGNVVTINLDIITHDEIDDRTAVRAIQEAFEAFKNGTCVSNYYNEDIATCGNILDGFLGVKAPADLYQFMDGKVFEPEMVQLPMVEIIGKFKGDVQYQLRYVRTLKPIILDDLHNYGDDLSIDGYSEAMECELPAETHEEILERAVTLAKLAWQGNTMTQAQAAQRERNRD